MRLIPKEFKANGYNYRLLIRMGEYAIYKQFNEKEVVMYELHKIRLQESTSTVIHGKEVNFEKKERLAGNSDWGRYGWTFFTLEDAEKKIVELGDEQ